MAWEACGDELGKGYSGHIAGIKHEPTAGGKIIWQMFLTSRLLYGVDIFSHPNSKYTAVEVNKSTHEDAYL